MYCFSKDLDSRIYHLNRLNIRKVYKGNEKFLTALDNQIPGLFPQYWIRNENTGQFKGISKNLL